MHKPGEGLGGKFVVGSAEEIRMYKSLCGWDFRE